MSATVVGIAAARQADLVTVVQLWHAARREQERLRELQAGRGRARLVHEARHVVISEKRSQLRRVGIQVIACEDLRQLTHGTTSREHLPDGAE